MPRIFRYFVYHTQLCEEVRMKDWVVKIVTDDTEPWSRDVWTGDWRGLNIFTLFCKETIVTQYFKEILTSDEENIVWGWFVVVIGKHWRQASTELGEVCGHRTILKQWTFVRTRQHIIHSEDWCGRSEIELSRI